MRHSPQIATGGKELRVLEIGCGAGANVPFFEHFSVDYYGVDGSEAVVEQLRSRFPAWQDRFAAADFTATIPFAGPFDMIVDRSSMTHNSEQDIRHGLTLMHHQMKTGGVYYGINWFSTQY
ncbi:MAG: class I SAM-dependent methyltransferase, partial [Magnetococcales bacterium]|nr:class I SAM-dependent methyltransferase [Magnetococcales bacterium]